MARRTRTSSVGPTVDRDLTELASAGRLPPAYGVDAAVTELLALLARGDKHPLLTGDAGVGKTALVQEAARRIAANQVEAPLQGTRVVEVSIATSGARGEKAGADALDKLFAHLASDPGTIVYLRDLPVALGTLMMPVVVSTVRAGELRFVLEADPRWGQALLRSDDALAERLHLVVVPEPSPAEVRRILARVGEDLEAEHALPVEPEALEQCYRLAVRFLLTQSMPRKAIELLRDTVAESAAAGRERVTAKDVLTRFCNATRLPRFVVDDALPLDLEQTQRFFADRILGQHEAVAAVLRSVALLKAGLNDPRRPLGVFLFAGPTGVGKTHLAKLLAEFLFGSGDRLVRLNMADFAHEGAESVPFGASWGQTYDQKRGELSRLLDGKVFAVLLLDEFEKAHPGVHDRFLQLFDEGRFVNAAGETIPCANTLIVATSNVGAEVYREPPMGFSGARSAEELVAEVDRRISETFRHEFLNRFDALCHFHPLTRTEIRRIAQREVGRVLERDGIRNRGLDVEVAPEVVDLLVERGYSPHFGARFLKREIEKTLTTALAVELVRRPLPPGTSVRVEIRPGGKVVARVEALAPSREATAQVQLPARGAATVKRRLDRRSLLGELDTLWARAGHVTVAAGRPGLEARRRELLGQSQAPDFWDEPERAARVLRDFRALDAQLSDMDRVMKALSSARRLVSQAKSEQHLAGAARSVEDAAREVQLLEARAAAGGADEVDDVLLDLECVQDSDACRAWVKELGYLYLAWAERRGYEGVALAEGEGPTRLLLRVSGPGVLGFLAGESGLHRRVEGDKKAAAFVRARHWPTADEEEAAEVDPRVVTTREVRRHAGFFVEKLGAEVTARDETLGREVRLNAALPPQAARALALSLLAPSPGGAQEARRYFLGRAARVEDPRTGASTPRVKDVLRGEIEVFIAAWVSRPAASVAS